MCSEKSHLVVEGPFVEFPHRSIGVTDAEVIHPAGDIATQFVSDELRVLSPVAAGVQTVARPSRSGLFSKPERDALATSRSGLFQLQSETLWLLSRTADRSTGSREGHGLAKFIFALGGLGELGTRAEGGINRVGVTGLPVTPTTPPGMRVCLAIARPSGSLSAGLSNGSSTMLASKGESGPP